MGLKNTKFYFCILLGTLLAFEGWSINLFCNNNFENYNLASSFPFTNYGYSVSFTYAGPDSCWYPIGTGQMEFQKPSYTNYSKMV